MRLGERITPEAYRFDNKSYVIGESYSFNDLPKGVRKDALSQNDDIEAHYGRSARTVTYKLVMVPHQELVRMLQERFGERGYSKRVHDPDLIAFARQIEREGLQQPPVADEGWHRAFALAYLGWDMPYFMVDEPIEMPGPTFIPTLDGPRMGATVHRYALKYRPPSFATLPPGWILLERPQMPGFERREDLPISRHRVGVVGSERPLTEEEIASYQLEIL
jgi:hypothetical protein